MFSRTPRDSPYKPLNTDTDSHADNERQIQTPSSPRTGVLVYWSLAICVACTLINALLTFGPSIVRVDAATGKLMPNSIVTRQNLHLLRRPSQFIGLDKISRPTPPVPREFIVYPLSVTLIDASDPTKVFDDYATSYMVHDGTVFPYDKKVLVTNTVSTVVQFQAIDWGMEICELHLDIPQSITTSTSAHRTSANLVLYRLNATHRLDITSLSYHNRPSRVSKLANLHLGLGDVTASDNIIFSEGVRWHRRFACTTDEVLSFELGCAVSPEVVESEAESCHVEWWQNRDKKTPSIYMIQHSTI